MCWKMPNVAAVTVAAVAALLLLTAETLLAASSSVPGGGGGGRYRGTAAATAAVDNDRQQDIDNHDKSPQTPSAVQCSSCLGHESMRSLSIELIKASILNKLGMERPPEFKGRRPPKVPTDLPPLQDLMRKYNDGHSHVVKPHNLRHKSHHYEPPSSIVPEMQSDEASPIMEVITSPDDEDDDYHVKTHKLIAFAQSHPTTPKIRGHYLLYFTFTEQTSQHQITKAVLWLYKRRTDFVAQESVVNIEVYRIIPSSTSLHQSVSCFKRVINTTEPGWMSIDLQRHMSDWFKSTDGTKNLTLLVQASYPSENMTHVKTPYVTNAKGRDDEIPYLEVELEDRHRSRSKRNVLGMDCSENSQVTQCCRYPLTVDFEDFGWDFIIAPKKYEASYCSGECPLVFLQKYPHTHLAQLTNKTGAYPGTGPCCAPRKMSAISMLYFDEDMNIVYGLLPGMAVDRCGCS